MLVPICCWTGTRAPGAHVLGAERWSYKGKRVKSPGGGKISLDRWLRGRRFYPEPISYDTGTGTLATAFDETPGGGLPVPVHSCLADQNAVHLPMTHLSSKE